MANSITIAILQYKKNSGGGCQKNKYTRFCTTTSDISTAQTENIK